MPTPPLIAILATGLGYWLLGVASNIFAIPPGFASPIWPSAGFAFLAVIFWGKRAVIGVFFASFFLNMGFSGAPLWPLSPAWISSLAIAGGAVLQALAARYLVFRLTNLPHIINQTSDALFLGLIGGPLACLISSTIGTGSLWLAGVLPTPALLLNWFHWWVGDSIGVMVFAPVILTMNIHFHRSRNPKFLGFLGLYFILITVASGIFFYAKEREFRSNESMFAEQANGFISSIELQLRSTINTSQSLSALFETYQTVDYPSFQKYSRSLFTQIPGTSAFGWIPIVPDSERKEREKLLPALGSLQTQFFAKAENGGTEPVATKPIYYPVYYIHPQASNLKAIGFDLSSHPGRNAALLQAIRSGRHIATQPITLVQETGSEKAFLLIAPIKDDQQSVQSFVSIVYRIEHLIQAALGSQTLANYSITIDDVTTGEADPFMATNVKGMLYQYDHQIEYAQRTWQISIQPSEELIKRHQSLWVWIILIFSFLFVTLLGLLVLLILSRTAAIQQEVESKTFALKAALDQAKESSSVKSAFLASMSHELRTPLNSVIGFSRRLSKGLAGKVEDRYMESIETIHRNGENLLAMINDVLDLSKVEAGKMDVNKSWVKLDDIINETITALSPAAEAKQLSLSAQPSPEEKLYVDPQRIRQVLTNLISNAVKFTDEGSVRITCKTSSFDDTPGLIIQVTDTGKGIAKEDIPRLFRRYEQLGNTFQGGQMGTGLGLALVHELVHLHQGHIEVSSEIGTGTQFSVWLPINTSD